MKKNKPYYNRKFSTSRGYKRLERVGDAVLKLLVVENCTDHNIPRGDVFDIEGNRMLAEIAQRLGVEPLLHLMPDHEFIPLDQALKNGARAKQRNKPWADALEVHLGYLYTEHGMKKTRKFFLNKVLPLYLVVKEDINRIREERYKTT